MAVSTNSFLLMRPSPFESISLKILKNIRRKTENCLKTPPKYVQNDLLLAALLDVLGDDGLEGLAEGQDDRAERLGLGVET